MTVVAGMLCSGDLNKPLSDGSGRAGLVGERTVVGRII